MNEKQKFWCAFFVILVAGGFFNWFLVSLCRTGAKNQGSATEHREPIPGIEQAGNGVTESIEQLEDLLTQLDDRISGLENTIERAESAAAEILRNDVLIEELALRIDSGISGIEGSSEELGVTTNSIQVLGEQIREQVQAIRKELDRLEMVEPGSVDPGSGVRDNF